jgi:hypothetical protein
MQLMPGTWVELSARYELGLDPFDPHDNIFAGAAYLKEIYDRFGSAGFLAAYHAGPARYEQHLATGKSLPPDTIAYVAAVRSVLASTPQFATAVQFPGEKLHCLSTARIRETERLLCVPHAATPQIIDQSAADIRRRADLCSISPMTIEQTIFRHERNRILSHSAEKPRALQNRIMDAGDERRGEAR